MSLHDATVSIPLSDWDAAKTRVAKLQAELQDAREQLEAAKLADPKGRIEPLAAAFADAMIIVRWIVANYDPLTVRGWPHKELARVAAALPRLAGVDDFTKESHLDLQIFARRAAEWEDARAKGIEKQKLAEENAARSPAAE